jgi:hypothetical protein
MVITKFFAQVQFLEPESQHGAFRVGVIAPRPITAAAKSATRLSRHSSSGARCRHAEFFHAVAESFHVLLHLGHLFLSLAHFISQSIYFAILPVIPFARSSGAAAFFSRLCSFAFLEIGARAGIARPIGSWGRRGFVGPRRWRRRCWRRVLWLVGTGHAEGE